jgi:hypothetical protein
LPLGPESQSLALKKQIEEATPTSQPVACACHGFHQNTLGATISCQLSARRLAAIPFSKDDYYCFDNFNLSLLAPVIEKYCQYMFFAINNQ